MLREIESSATESANPGTGERSSHYSSRRLSRRQLLGLSLPWFAPTFLFAALLPIIIPAQIALYIAPGKTGNASQALFLGVAAAIGAVISLTLQPVAGALSDRGRTRLGRRLPYVAGGAIISLIGLALLALTQQFTLFVIGLLLALIANAITGAASQGLIPDCVPVSQRGAASGYVGLMTLLGTVGSLAVASLAMGGLHGSRPTSDSIAHGAALFYGIAAAVLVVIIGLALLIIRENRLAIQVGLETRALGLHEEEQASGSWLLTPRSRRARLVTKWLAPWRSANFRWVFLARASVMLGLALFMTYIEYYFARVEHVANFVQATAVIAILSLVGGVVSALVIGILSDRIGRRAPIVCIAGAMMAIAALAFVVAPGSIPLWPLGVIFGLGYGAFTSVDMALAIDTLPSPRAAGKDLGLWSIASTLPAVVAPVIGSAVILVASGFGQLSFGYRAVFALAAGFLILGSTLALKVRERRKHGHRGAERQAMNISASGQLTPLR